MEVLLANSKTKMGSFLPLLIKVFIFLILFVILITTFIKIYLNYLKFDYFQHEVIKKIIFMFIIIKNSIIFNVN